MSDLLYSDVEDDLRAGLRALLAEACAWPDVLAGTETDAPYDAALWERLTEMGVTALPVPEAAGGAGASWREASVVLEELGRAVAPVPFLGAAVLGTAALLAAGAPDLAADASAVLAVPLSTPPGAAPDGVRADGGRLTGVITAVADAGAAATLLVPAGDGLYAVDPGADGVRVTEVVALDMTRRLSDVALADAPARRIGDTGAVTAALTTGAALLAAEQLGIAERCLEMTVEYVRTRYQFGRPVGSYQALKHRLADLWAAVAQARAVVRYAAGCAASGDPDLPVAAAVAQAHCSATAVRAAEECVQMHGGIGFTWEHPAHLYLKRAKSASLALGTADRHRAALAGLVGLPA
ncbi:Acyl-CoA dehydrogenase [Actinomadura rubteroloni]|uniref:Acyl-CoA dehydrogenase n=1 Tax=Actinomadura rubteroloni TaxID=1926885 RepID=A0A2P4UBN0_9ACTN|nr:acyl-CoA dehydrogenase family protein [Actinomadura rubteroloni]POM22449.1 Acyl-CoA dehydrogenase [Actinomadura rubteroloni]